MQATWNLDTTNGNNFVPTLRLDGVNDAYLTEGAQLQEVQVVNDQLTFTPVSEVFNFEGQEVHTGITPVSYSYTIGILLSFTSPLTYDLQ